MNEPRMVDLPWVDGTTRTVPEWTLYTVASGSLFTARDGGYSPAHDPSKSWGKTIYPHVPDSAAVRIFTEAPEPPVKVTVPTGLGAIVSLTAFLDDPGYVLTRDGWRGLGSYIEHPPSEIADELRAGARVLYEGVADPEPEGSAPPEPAPAVDDTDATPLSSYPVTLRDLEGRKWKRVTRSDGDVVYEHGSLTPLTIHDLVYIDGSVTDVSSGRTITANDLGDLT